MWFPTVSKVRLQYEEFLVRVEMVDAAALQALKSLDVETSIFGQIPEVDQFRKRCAVTHRILSDAVDGLLGGQVSPRQLAGRISKVENEVRGLEQVAERLRLSIDAMKAA